MDTKNVAGTHYGALFNCKEKKENAEIRRKMMDLDIVILSLVRQAQKKQAPHCGSHV